MGLTTGAPRAVLPAKRRGTVRRAGTARIPVHGDKMLEVAKQRVRWDR